MLEQANKQTASAVMDAVRRGRKTEEWVRSVDAADIVERLHFMEDESDDRSETIGELEEKVAKLEKENKQFRKWLQELAPHTEAIICYASSMDEHPPNRTAKEVSDWLAGRGAVTIDYQYNAQVISVYDGDSIRCDIDLGFGVWLHNQAVRLLDIDTPEIRGLERPEGLVVRDLVRSRILNERVVLHTYQDKTGKYGRWLAEVWLGEESINRWLLDQGLAEEMGR